MLAVVTSGASAGITNATAFSTWRRTTTHVPLPHWGGVGDSFVLVGGKYQVTGPALDAYLFTSDGVLHEAGANGEVFVLGPSGQSAPMSVPAASSGNMAAAEVGVPFVQQVDQLPPALDGKEARVMHISLTRMSAEVVAFGTVELGQDVDHMQVCTVPSDALAPLELAQTMLEARVANRWTKGAVGVVRQRLPLPLEVRGLTREVEFQKP
jgi:hypothetical protein